MPTNLLSNLKIGNKGPYWLNVPYFEPTATGADNVTWTYTTEDINLGTVGTQIIIKAPADLKKDTTSNTTLNGIQIICNAGGLSTSSYPKGSYLQLVYDGANWVILN